MNLRVENGVFNSCGAFQLNLKRPKSLYNRISRFVLKVSLAVEIMFYRRIFER